MTHREVAEWMLAEFKKRKELYQEDAVYQSRENSVKILSMKTTVAIWQLIKKY